MLFPDLALSPELAGGEDRAGSGREHADLAALIEPPQGAVVEKILRHCGLWNPSTPRAPPATDGWVYDPDGDSDSQTAPSDEPRELTYVDIDTFEATF